MSMNQTKRFFKRLAVTLGLAATVAIPVQSVQGQESGVSQGNLLEEIIVTARRREESLKDVPVAISVLSGDYIAEAMILDQFDFFAETPGIHWDQALDRQGARPSIRGVGTRRQNPRVQKLSFFLDGAPILGNPGSLQFIGLDRIEVMRGPQSAAFGRSTFGGVINYISKDPGTEFNSEINIATSDLSRDLLSVSLDGPITDTLGFTFDAHFDEFEGPDEWGTTDGLKLGGTSSDYVTGKLKFTPSASFDMEIRLSSLRTEDDQPLLTVPSQAARDACSNITLPTGQPYIDGTFNCDVSSSTPPGGIPRNIHPEETLTPGTFEFFLAQTFSVLDPGATTDRDRISAEFNFSMNDGSLLQVMTSYTEEEAFRWNDSDESNIAPVFGVNRGMVTIAGVDSRANPRTVEERYFDVRWLSPGEDPVRWMVGASWYDWEFSASVLTQFAGILLGLEDEANGGQPFGFRNFQDVFTTNLGLYANLTWDVTDRTTLSFEGRFQDDDVTSIDVLGGRTFESVTESFQPRLAVNHALNDNWSIYGQYSSGTNPGGHNLIFTDPVKIDSLAAANAAGFITYDHTTFRAFEEEELTNFEVGIKGSALDNRLQLTAAVYFLDWDDMTLPVRLNWNDPSWNTGAFDPQGRIFSGRDTRTGNVGIDLGDGELSGVELEANYQANDRWSFRAAAVVSSNEFKENCDQAAVNNFGFTPTRTIAEGATFDCVDVAGNKIIGQPEESGALSATYRAPLAGGGWEWAARLGLRYVGPQFMDNLNLLELPGTSEYNGSVTFSNDNWEIVLFGNNLTDEDTPYDVVVTEDLNISPLGDVDNYRLSLRIPREIGLRLNYRF